MKNLYMRLRVNRTANHDEIRAAISTLPMNQDREDATAVLLNERRKSIYDHHISTIEQVAQIRSNIYLSNTVLWDEAVYSDFLPLARSREASSRPQTASASKTRSSPVLSWLLLSSMWLIVLVGALYLGSYLFEKNQNRNNDTNLVMEDASETPVQSYSDDEYDSELYDDPAFNEPELAMPQDGMVWTDYTNRIAPLRISVPSEGYNYFVKMKSGDEVVLYVFIHSGSTVNVKMPLGVYTMQYAYGEKWYGFDFLFGPDTKYYQAEDLFSFYEDGNRVLGAKVELILQKYGNLETSRISPDDF